MDLISESFVTQNNLEIRSGTKTFIDFNGMLFQAKKFVNLQITANGRTVAVKLWVFENLSFDMLLGVKTLSALAITSTNLKPYTAYGSQKLAQNPSNLWTGTPSSFLIF